MKHIKIIKPKTNLICDACNGIIKRGEKTVQVKQIYTKYRKWTQSHYYHYRKGIELEEFLYMSNNEIREKICKYKEKED